MEGGRDKLGFGFFVGVVVLVIFWRPGPVSCFHEGICPHPSGYSMGSQHFCGHERCSHTNYPHGMGLFQSSSSRWGNPGPQHVRDVPLGISLVNLTVTQISVNGVVLKGWFHFRVDIPPDFPLYLLYVSVVTEEKDWYLPIGEFTTDLLTRCDGVTLAMTPTQSELLPCGSTYWSSLIYPNSVMYSREALVPGNHDNPAPIPRKPNVARNITHVPEFHMHWKMSPGTACVNYRKVLVRVEALTYPAHLHHPVDFASCTPPNPNTNNSQTCPLLNPYNVTGPASPGPRTTAHKRTTIHFPSPTLSQGFYGPDPSPPFLDAATAVNCRVAMATVDRTTVPPPLPTAPLPAPPYIEVNGTLGCTGGRPCNPDYFSRNVGVRGGAKVNCNLPFALSPSANRSGRPLYTGRCYKPVRGGLVINGLLNVDSPLMCRNSSELEPEDRALIDTLPNMTQYIEHFRYDVCNCDGRLPRVDNGTLNFEPPQDGAPVRRTTPAPDYPSDNGNGLSLGSLSISLNQTNQEQPGDTILKMVKRARMLHGTLYGIAFLFVIPVAIFMARYMKETFYGLKFIVYDLWYSVHAFGTMFVFVLMQPAQMIIYGGRIWSRNADPVERTAEEKLHAVIGWVVLALYAILSVTGGFRCYDQNSGIWLLGSIWFHAITGYIFYVLAMAAMIVVLIGSQSGSALAAAILVIVWIVIDVAFHLAMTFYVKLMDRRNYPGLERPVFPVMANITQIRNAPGRRFRLVMFGVYLGLSIVVTGVFVVLTLSSEGFNTADRSTYTFKGRAAQAGADRQNRY